MTGYLRQSTASQGRAIGPFVDDTDFKTAETGLTIANTDIKLSANGGASANKNSGGGTHLVNGVYGVTFDATDTATVGELFVSVKVAGALPVFHSYVVLEEAVYDALFAASAPGYVANAPVNVAQFGGAAGTFAAGRPEVNATHIAGSAVSTSAAQIGVNVVNAAGTAWNSGAIGAATLATDTITAAKIAADAIGASELAADAVAEVADAVWDEARSGHVSAGSFGEGVASVQGNVTGSVASIALGGIAAASFAAGAIDAAAIAADAIGTSELAASAASEIATAVRTELATELGRVDAAVSTRLAPTVAGRTLDVSLGGEAGVDWANVGSPTTVVGLSGTTVKTATDVETDTADIQSRLPAALVSGRMDSSVGAMAADTVTAAAIATGAIDADAIATDAITAAKIAADAIGASELAASAVSEIQSGLSTLDAAGVRSAVGMASANLDTQIAGILTTAMTESYNADGSPATAAQALYAILQRLTEFAISGTSLTVKKLDGTTTAFVLTLDDATNPSSSARTS